MNMTYSEMIKECRVLAKSQNLTFRRSKKVGKINGKACYEIKSGIACKILHKGSLIAIWDTLLSESLAGQ